MKKGSDEKPAEPLCWEEQLNSNQVKFVKKRKIVTPMVSDHKEIDSHPVVFHQKNSVQEILKKQKMRFHLTSCHLPKLPQSMKNTKSTNYKPPVKYLLSSKQVKNKKASFNDRLELKGSGMHSSDCNKKDLRNGTGKLPEEQIYFHKEMYGCLHEHTRVQSDDMIDISPDSPENNIPTLNNTSYANKKYVDVPVLVPNPALTDDSCSIVSEARDLNFEIISSDKTNKYKEMSNEVKAVAILQRCSYSRHSTEGKSKFVSKITVPVETPCDDFGKESLRESNTTTSSIVHKPRESRESRTSSRLIYTPSNPPLFLSDEILELPKGVSPNKALVDLRQTFCENIRRETEQLEFDLKELYLKKQLHQR